MTELIKQLREPQFNVFHAMKLCEQAADALERMQWIPVTDSMPEADDKVLCCTQNKRGDKNIVMGYFNGERWCCGMNTNVVAWMPLPEVYKGDAK